MATGRMIAKAIAHDDRLAGLSMTALAAYLAALPHLDRDGLIDGRPLILYSMIAPLRADLLDSMPAVIQEWIAAGLVSRYNGDQRPVLLFVDFPAHNPRLRYDRETESLYPPPPGLLRCPAHGLYCAEDESEHADCHGRSQAKPPIWDKSGLSPDQVRTKSGLSPDQVPLKINRSSEAGGGGAVHTYLTHVMETGGDRGGADPGAGGLYGALGSFEPDQLRTVANELGALTNLASELNGWDRMIRDSEPATLILLIGWCYYVNERPADSVGNPAGLVYAMMRKGARPALRPYELRALAEMAALILARYGEL